MADLHAAAKAVLDCGDVVGKPNAARALAAAFRAGELAADEASPPPQAIAMPGRPATPMLVHPRDLPRRGFGSTEGRAAFIHAVAHIEFNAIDLACDAVYRFRGLPADYYADWVKVADDEARHFTMMRERLLAFGHDYGDFDAHNGLWEMAEKTTRDGLARMALVPRVLEARGLDVTPGMIVKLRALGDDETADILEVILREEVAHVAAGSRWYRWHCERAGIEPRTRFRELLKEYASGVLHKPFNIEARMAAGFSEAELEELVLAAAPGNS
ncbi:MAG: ferritin-like domain-containing protein [Proteobacteria bacterium]|nr:ferritin-like domain-containing protein [Pseudomonadota bacterium]